MLKVFLNDKLVDGDKAVVSASDAGLLYGMGLFETMRACNGVVFELDEHLDRLFTSAKELSINNTYKKKFIKEAIKELLKANNLKEARLRLTITNGSVSSEQGQPQTTLVITATEFAPYPDGYYQNGVMVVLCPFRQNTADPVYGHKTTSYMSRMLGLKFAHQKKAAEALWFTHDNRLAEGCISNIFLVKDSVVYTPQLSTPVLAGIARKTVLKLTKEYSIRAEEKNLDINELLDADEVFLTNIVMQVLPVTKIEKQEIAGGKVGPVTMELQKCFSSYIKKYCGIENENK
ncbi:MAG: aminotransferase class IV family protein [Sedimentisphaerales bacterium]|nr:aminotransferase class IV family protein [Sedimentisphaerales bacterium]